MLRTTFKNLVVPTSVLGLKKVYVECSLQIIFKQRKLNKISIDQFFPDQCYKQQLLIFTRKKIIKQLFQNRTSRCIVPCIKPHLLLDYCFEFYIIVIVREEQIWVCNNVKKTKYFIVALKKLIFSKVCRASCYNYYFLIKNSLAVQHHN